MSGRVHFLSWISVVAISGCGVGPNLGPKPVPLSDANVAPMLKAMAAVDRAALGFTPIPTNANVLLEIGSRSDYDTMLHIYADTHRTIAFRKTPDGFRWIAEQEKHYGPKMFTHPTEGTIQEYLVIQYQIEPVNGIPTNRILVRYTGLDARLTDRSDLTLSNVQPIIEEWKGTPIR